MRPGASSTRCSRASNRSDVRTTLAFLIAVASCGDDVGSLPDAPPPGDTAAPDAALSGAWGQLSYQRLEEPNLLVPFTRGTR